MDTRDFIHKYNIKRVDGKPLGRTFTIEIDKDPKAVEILLALSAIYIETCPELSATMLAIAEELRDAVDALPPAGETGGKE